MATRPFFTRLIVTFAGVIALVVAVCGTVIYLAGQRAARAQQIEELARLTKLVREQLPNPTGAFSIDAQEKERLTALAEALATRVTLIDGAGTVVFDTQHDPSTMENHNDRPEVIEARRVGSGSAVRFSRTMKEDAVYVAQPLDAQRPEGLIVRLSYPRRVWSKLAVPPIAIVLAAVLTAALLMAWLALLLQRRWIGPVRALSEAAGKMAGGEWHTRVPPRGDDEIREFSGSLNHLAEQAEKQLADLEARRHELQTLVDSLPDPILLTDAEHRVALINTPAANLLQLAPKQALGKKLVGVLNDEALVGLFETAARSDASAVPLSDVRLTRDGQRLIYQALATRTRGGGVMLVLRDVSAMSNTVQMKTDFVANASHELRTPIAAIKIAFETLQEVHREDPTQTEKCIAIISGHVKRLEEMLEDLLDLSRVESADLKPHFAAVRVEDVFAMVRGTMSVMARQKLVELVFERAAAGTLVEFESDRRLLNLVLRNLVENSIKFTPPGGRVTVSVGGAGTNGDVELRVADTGCGIPPEHQERVFERFYQVDPARSGAVGRGTGLGLAIVKHAVNALSGSVRLQSTVGVGTTVTCRFPVHSEAAVAR